MSTPIQKNESSTGSTDDLPLLNRPLLVEGDATVVNRSDNSPPEGDFTISTGADELRARLFPATGTPSGQEEGLKLGHFEVQRKIGAGGMGAVFLAKDLDLNRDVALKILNPKTAADPSLVARFRKEARASAQLNHDNVARVFYTGEQDGVPFIAYEYAAGRTIRELILANGKLPVPEVVNYAIQVTLALSHLDACGIVHRDIKPSNIIRSPNGRIKVVDLGLARHETEDSIGDLTVAGTTLGTFDYISPEQARDPRTADTRSDIYSLGCTMFHMLTGAPPYDDGNAIQKLLDHQGKDSPDLLATAPQTPKMLVSIIAKMMDPDPKLRYQDPGQLLADLITLASQLGLSSVPADGIVWKRIPVQRTRELSGTILISSVALLCCLIAFSIHFFPSFRGESEEVNAMISNLIGKTNTQAPNLKPFDETISIPRPLANGAAADRSTEPSTNNAGTPTANGPLLTVVSADGTETEFTSLSTAWSTVRNGDEILLNFDGDRPVRRFPKLSVGEAQIVRIRAKEGRTPTLVFQSEKREPSTQTQMVELSSQLQLRLTNIGIRFEVLEQNKLPTSRSYSVFDMLGANRLILNNCAIDVVNESNWPVNVVRVRDTATSNLEPDATRTQIEFVDCSVRGNCHLIQYDTARAAEVNLQNNMFVLNGSILKNSGANQPIEVGTVDVRMTYCSCFLFGPAMTFADSDLLDGEDPERSLAFVDVESQSNVFASGQSNPFLFSSGNASLSDQQQRLKWRGSYNRFFRWAELWSLRQSQEEEPLTVKMSPWTDFWNQQPNGLSNNETEMPLTLWKDPDTISRLSPETLFQLQSDSLTLDKPQFDLGGDGSKPEKVDDVGNYPGVDLTRLPKLRSTPTNRASSI